MGAAIKELAPRVQELAQRLYDEQRKPRKNLVPVCPLPDPQPQRDQAPALGGTVQGKEKGDGRIGVRFVGYRVKPLDPDNFAGSVKDLLDGLRHAELLLGDEPWRIRLETEQEKVAHYRDERTVITITYPQ